MSEVHVDIETLTQHAARLGAVEEQIGLAAGAAGQVNLNDGAFGLLCAFLPLVITGFETTTGDAIAASRESVTATVAEVRAMAATYAQVDADVARRLDSVARGGAPVAAG